MTVAGGTGKTRVAKTTRGAKTKTAEPDLATAPVQARRFVAARRRRASATLEDYTELIADLIARDGEARTTDIAERLGVAHPTASKAIGRLEREGLALVRPYRGAGHVGPSPIPSRGPA